MTYHGAFFSHFTFTFLWIHFHTGVKRQGFSVFNTNLDRFAPSLCCFFAECDSHPTRQKHFHLKIVHLTNKFTDNRGKTTTAGKQENVERKRVTNISRLGHGYLQTRRTTLPSEVSTLISRSKEQSRIARSRWWRALPPAYLIGGQSFGQEELDKLERWRLKIAGSRNKNNKNVFIAFYYPMDVALLHTLLIYTSLILKYTFK